MFLMRSGRMAGQRTSAVQAFYSSDNPSIVEKAREAVGKVTEKVGEMFEETGSVGKQFTPHGAAGGTAQEVGEGTPLDKDGAIGHQFTTDGAIGGTVQDAAESLDQKGEEMQRKAQQNQGKEKLKEDTPGMSRDKM